MWLLWRGQFSPHKKSRDTTFAHLLCGHTAAYLSQSGPQLARKAFWGVPFCFGISVPKRSCVASSTWWCKPSSLFCSLIVIPCKAPLDQPRLQRSTKFTWLRFSDLTDHRCSTTRSWSPFQICSCLWAFLSGSPKS